MNIKKDAECIDKKAEFEETIWEKVSKITYKDRKGFNPGHEYRIIPLTNQVHPFENSCFYATHASCDHIGLSIHGNRYVWVDYNKLAGTTGEISTAYYGKDSEKKPTNKSFDYFVYIRKTG